MKAYVGNTDYDWYKFLSTQDNLDEVNFWQPGGGRGFRVLKTGDPFFFKLKARHDHAIAGFGLFVLFRQLSVLDAWEAFGESNGAQSFAEMMTRVGRYVKVPPGESVSRHHTIGCILLAAPIFFPKEMWVRGPSNWKRQIVSGKTYDTNVGEGRRIWNECIERAQLLSLPNPTVDTFNEIIEGERYGSEIVVRPRLGQGTFRYVVEKAYGQCAVTSEHSLPALEAAHIRPYKDAGPHDVRNGLLLRADIHKLHDRGYVTVTPDYRFRVSSELEQVYHNGRVYYELDGSRILLPKSKDDWPLKEYLEYHSGEIFRA